MNSIESIAENDTFTAALIQYGEVTTKMNTQGETATQAQQEAMEAASVAVTDALTAIIDAHCKSQIAAAICTK